MQSRKRATTRSRRRAETRLALALLGTCLAATTGCDITSFVGPVFVLPNTTVKYEVNVQSGAAIGSAFDLHVMLRVPILFTLTLSSYNEPSRAAR